MLNLLMPYPAALIKTQKTRTLVVADLHIGWELALSEKGIHVTTQMPKLLQKVKELIQKHKPNKLMILGDVKHTVATAKLGEWKDVPDFFNGLKNEIDDVGVIRGNHDGNLKPLLPQNVKILPGTGIIEGDIGLFHGHRWPSPSLLQCKTLMMGHVHPVVAFLDPAGFRIRRQVWVKAECDGPRLAEALLRKDGRKIKEDAEKTLWERYNIKPEASHLLIIPSFNDFLGGRPLNRRIGGESAKKAGLVGPVVRSEAVDMENAEIHLLDGTFLGSLNKLRSLNE